eukprot:1539206-Alexandrium_andersonii.AAC.1
MSGRSLTAIRAGIGCATSTNKPDIARERHESQRRSCHNTRHNRHQICKGSNPRCSRCQLRNIVGTHGSLWAHPIASRLVAASWARRCRRSE